MKIFRSAIFAPFPAYVGLALIASGLSLDIVSAQAKTTGKDNLDCVPAGSWTVPGEGKISGTEVINRAAGRSVVVKCTTTPSIIVGNCRRWPRCMHCGRTW